MSELSPLDILGKKFAVKFRGYPANEVHEYLTEIAGSMEALMRERGELRQQVHRLTSELASFRDREAALHEALVAAQRTAETTMETARRHAALAATTSLRAHTRRINTIRWRSTTSTRFSLATGTSSMATSGTPTTTMMGDSGPAWTARTAVA